MKKLFSIFILIWSVQNASAQFDYGFDFSKAGSGGFQFLKIAVGARETALGNAATALSNSANTVFWNVGNLGFITERQIQLSQNEWLVNSKHSAAALAFPLGGYVIGLSIVNLSIDEFEETTVQSPLGTGRMVNAGDLMVGLSLAKQFTDKLSIGGQVKYVREELDVESFNNVLFDIGTTYYTGFHNLRLAFALQHFGPDIQVLDLKFRMPLLFRVSAAEDIISTSSQRFSTAIELVHPTDNNEWVNWGLEYEFQQFLALRGGYRINVDEGNLAFGAGLKSPKMMGVNFNLDYAYVNFGEIFGATHRFSIGFIF